MSLVYFGAVYFRTFSEIKDSLSQTTEGGRSAASQKWAQARHQFRFAILLPFVAPQHHGAMRHKHHWLFGIL